MEKNFADFMVLWVINKNFNLDLPYSPIQFGSVYKSTFLQYSLNPFDIMNALVHFKEYTAESHRWIGAFLPTSVSLLDLQIK